MVLIGKIKFIHSADLHLDSPFKGLRHVPEPIFQKVKESTFNAFKRIVDLAITEKVDFLLIAGDLFDDNARSLRAQVKLREGLNHLADHGIEVYIIHGNHDHLSGDYANISWPENVHIFSREVEVKAFRRDGKTLAHIYGFSYGQRAVIENMTQFYQKQDGALYHIGMLHGNLQGSSNNHDPYAPFTVDELLSKQFDYWALGHIHKRQVINEDPVIRYPGNIQGRHLKETGEKGCYVVEMDKGKSTSKFVPVADIIWDMAEITIDDIETFDELIYKIQTLKNKYRLLHQSFLLALNFTGSGPLHNLLQQPNTLDEILEIINESEETEQYFVWTVLCQINTTVQYNRELLKSESHFLGDLLKLIDDNQADVLEKALMTLNKNRNATRHLEALNDDEKKEILENAERLLLQELLKE